MSPNRLSGRLDEGWLIQSYLEVDLNNRIRWFLGKSNIAAYTCLHNLLFDFYLTGKVQETTVDNFEMLSN